MAKDGMTGELFIVQARPETVQAHRSRDVLETYYLDQRSQVLAEGRSVGGKIAAGKARVITEVPSFPVSVLVRYLLLIPPLRTGNRS
jgi:pyruvate,water dikinase